MLINTPLKNSTSISITPLIDVVFILLLFFMLSSTFQKKNQFEINSSTLEGNPSLSLNKSYKLILDVDDMVYIDGIKHSQSSDKFNTYLSALIQNDEQLIISANPEVKTQKFIKLLDSLKEAGIVNLNIKKTQLP